MRSQMSQHYFSTTHEGRPITVTLGWDRPLGHYFMVIERDEAGGSLLYSNLREKRPFAMSLGDFKTKLVELTIQVPASMFEQIERDQAFDVGNRYVRYALDGSFAEN